MKIKEKQGIWRLLNLRLRFFDGKYLSLPRAVFEKIRSYYEVDVVLKLKNMEGQRNMGEDAENERMRRAFEQYRAKYSDEVVDMNDFQYVGILPKDNSEDNKSALIKTIEEKYYDI